MIEVIGYSGSFLLAMCGLPLAIVSMLTGHSKSTPMSFLMMWFFGEFLSMLYVLSMHGFDRPLMTNYVANIIFISIVLYYKLFPRKQK